MDSKGSILFILVLLNISCTISSPYRDPRQLKEGRIGFPLTNTQALDRYRLGWATGDTQIIMNVVNNATFTFTWVPDQNEVSAADFPQFFEKFMADAEAKTNKKYFMVFDSIIHREINGFLYEAGDWIVEGFARGSYFSTARNGKVNWEMATPSQLRLN